MAKASAASAHTRSIIFCTSANSRRSPLRQPRRAVRGLTTELTTSELALHRRLDMRDRLPHCIESREVRERGYGVAQGAIGRVVVVAAALFGCLVPRAPVRASGHPSESSATTRGLKVSALRIGDDPERDGADSRVNPKTT